MTYLELIFKDITEEKKEILIAELSAISFEGFEEKDNQLSAFIPKSNLSLDSLNELLSSMDCSFEMKNIEQQNWNAEWERDFQPILVVHPENDNEFCYVRADFHPPKKDVQIDLIINPKMSFGTGHHATTYLMMEQMSLLDFKNKSVVDFGTGTGVLSILAEKMGCSSVVAIDCDEWSIDNAKENITANQCNRIQLLHSDTCKLDQIQADIMLANINLNIITSELSNIVAACKSDASLLFSGVLDTDEESINKALLSHGLNVHQIKVRNHWMMIFASLP